MRFPRRRAPRRTDAARPIARRGAMSSTGSVGSVGTISAVSAVSSVGSISHRAAMAAVLGPGALPRRVEALEVATRWASLRLWSLLDLAGVDIWSLTWRRRRLPGRRNSQISGRLHLRSSQRRRRHCSRTLRAILPAKVVFHCIRTRRRCLTTRGGLLGDILGGFLGGFLGGVFHACRGVRLSTHYAHGGNELRGAPAIVAGGATAMWTMARAGSAAPVSITAIAHCAAPSILYRHRAIGRRASSRVHLMSRLNIYYIRKR